MNYLLLLILSVASMWLYFPLAKGLRLIDKPNERSSHKNPTYRGAGIIFIFTYLFSLLLFDQQSTYLTGGLLIASLTGFLDDYKGMKASVRALLYLIALVLCMLAIPDLTIVPWYYMLLIVVVGLGTVNAYNFMDGINGISVLYTSVLFLTCLWLNNSGFLNYSESLLTSILLACVVFGFLNLRKKARAFMGDVGSVLLGMLAVYLVVSAIWQTRDMIWLLLVLVYGVDSIFTIIGRLKNRENIFEAHRRHLYQLLSNELGMPQLQVSAVYAILQLFINFAIISLALQGQGGFLPTASLAIGYALIYTAVRVYVLRRIEKLDSTEA